MISVLAGLLTEPKHYAQGIRLDWLLRLVFSKAQGQRKPSSEEISRALNAGLERAGVLRLEDPSEDLSCHLITTPKGNFRIFTGQWETAGPYTQTLLDAFQALPDGPWKRDVLASTHAALRLSDALAERSGVVPLVETGGAPQGNLLVPNIRTLKRLASRVRFSDADLADLGIDKGTLVPFIIDPRDYPYVSDRKPGDTPLELHPLLIFSNGIIIASPAGISLAIRAILVNAAKQGGVDKSLSYFLLKAQQKYSETSGFWPVRNLALPPPDKHFLRVATCQFAEGHFLQVIQVPVTFDTFPQLGFGSVVELSEHASRAIANYVHEFWEFLGQQINYRKGITVVLMSGWGTPHTMAPPIANSREPEDWQFLYLSFADSAILGACEGGKFSDVIRIFQQVKCLDREGFVFQNANGTLNLFGFWRHTNSHLIPEHWEMEPPCLVSIPTDELLNPRLEAVRRIDMRGLPLPEEGFRTDRPPLGGPG